MPKFSYKKRDIQALVYLAQKDDIKALEELVRRVQKNIYALFAHLVDKREDISDLTQETLLKMAKSLPQLKDVTKFKSWLNQIITNSYYDFIRKKLVPAYPDNDGAQTPTKNHPVFIAQHATGTCCRGCLEKWHKIPKGVELTDNQINYVVALIMEWIKRKY